MHAVTFEITIPSFLIGKSLGAVTESAIFGGLSRVRYRDVEEPLLPADDWVRLEVLEAGICGTDIGTLTFQSSPILEPFGSLPAVLGHEVLARVSEVGPAVRRVEPGQRVAVDPMILMHHARVPRRSSVQVLRERSALHLRTHGR